MLNMSVSCVVVGSVAPELYQQGTCHSQIFLSAAKERLRFLLWQGLQARGLGSFDLKVNAWQSEWLTPGLVVERCFLTCLLGRIGLN